MKAHIIKISGAVLAAFLLVYVVFQIFGASRDDYTTQTVYAQEVAHTISVKGIFFREETVIPVGTAGVVNSYCSVGSKVAVQTPLGCVYQDDAAVRDRYRLQDLESTLNALKAAENAASITDVVKPEVLNGQAADYVSRIIAGRDDGDLSGLTDLKAGLLEVMARRSLVLSEASSYMGRITRLEQQIASLENSVAGDVNEFFSTASGYYVDHVDGWEDTLTQEYLQEMSAADVVGFVSAYSGYRASQSSVKVVPDHQWQFVVALSEQELQNLAGSASVSLRFPNRKEQVQMTVRSTEMDSSGLYKVCLEGDTVDAYLLRTRVQSAEIVVTNYSGLKIPKEALRFPENEMGVYVLIGDKVYFRKIDQIYETTDYVLSRTYHRGDSQGAEYVKLYDTIIVEGKDLYDQKLLR